MKLIFIYGPSAVGKLTVANALAAQTGFGVVHNHLTHDLACALFDEKTDEFRQLCDHLRCEIFTKAVQKDVAGLIFTFGYRVNLSDNFVKQVISIVESGGGKVYFIQLKCSLEKQLERVVSETRKCFKKIVAVEELRKEMEEHVFDQTIRWIDSLIIDNSYIEPSIAAKMVTDHFGLPMEK
jgi:hypothetical protein